MLFFMFTEDELGGVFERLGYEYGAETARKTIEYYDSQDFARLNAEPRDPRRGAGFNRSPNVLGAIPGPHWRVTSATFRRGLRRRESI